MRSKLNILVTMLVVMLLVGCEADQYEWDTNNTSILEGEYQTRDTSLDLDKATKESLARSMSQRVLYSNEYTVGISVSIQYEDDSVLDFAYGCKTLKEDVAHSSILSYENGPESNCEENLTSDNRFKLGSLTKTTVGRTLLDIDNDSNYNFDLDDLVTEHLPENILALGDLSGITINHLLKHTSGLNKIDFEEGTVEEIIGKVLAKGRLSRNPGQVYAYNNAAYILLGEVIKHITRSDNWQGQVMQRINESIGENAFIFPENGTANSAWVYTSDTNWMAGKEGTLISGSHSLAYGYSYFEGALENVVEYYSGADRAHSAGSLIGTVPDLTRWMQNIATNDTHLLVDDYFVAEVLDTNSYTNIYEGRTHWNLGAGLGFDKNQNAFFHLGNIEGYACHAVYSKNEKTTISVCVNGSADLVSFPYDLLNAMYPYRTDYIPTTTE